MTKVKKCSDCGETKPLSEFYKDNSRNDGFAYRCKQCESKKRSKSTNVRYKRTHRRQRRLKKYLRMLKNINIANAKTEEEKDEIRKEPILGRCEGCNRMLKPMSLTFYYCYSEKEQLISDNGIIVQENISHWITSFERGQWLCSDCLEKKTGSKNFTEYIFCWSCKKWLPITQIQTLLSPFAYISKNQARYGTNPCMGVCDDCSSR